MSDGPGRDGQELRRALVNFLGERSKDNLHIFFDLLRESRVLLPAQLDGLSEEQQQQLKSSGRLQVAGQLRVKPAFLQAGDKKYLSVFTCRGELEKGPKTSCVNVPLQYCRQILERESEVAALLIDPFSKPNLLLEREKVDAVLAGTYRGGERVQAVRLAAGTRVVRPDPFPQELAGSLYVLLDNLAGVERAWLFRLEDPRQKSWLAVVEYHDLNRDTLTAMLASAAKKHGQGLPLGLLPYEGEEARRLTEGCEPFFVSGDRAGRTLLN
ncbi:MAG: enhanced serine sensitivity protein SseB C-terminal domain-containing protein [Firmicutes bacterium]|nr:enhanced serine sensitivity protein SseB C-terminal domain-containing protein [Bacillota bacterium]